MGLVRPPAMGHGLPAVLAVGVLLFTASAQGRPSVRAAGSCQNTTTLPTTRAEQRDAEAAVLCLVNRERTKRGLRALRRHRTLTKVAARLSDEMVAQQFFDHTTPDGRDLRRRLRAARWRGSSAGENIAWGTGDLGTPARIVQSWMHSPGHRANILHRSFRRGGVGVTSGAPEDVGELEAATYTMDYDTP